MDVLANEYLRKKDWTKAVDLYNKLLQSQQINKQQIVSYLLGRSECLLELGNHEAVVVDCKNIIKLLADRNESDNGGSRARKRLVHALFLLKRFAEAELAAREWLILLKERDDNADVKLLLENFLDNCAYFNSKQKFESLFRKLEHKLSTSDAISNAIKMDHRSMAGNSQGIACIYCNLTFSDKMELRAHCQTETHEMMIMSDEGHDWHWRPPPRGYKSDTYTLCDNWRELGSCRFGSQCIQAHGVEELAEWKERFHYREMKLQRARDKELLGKSYTEELLEKWTQTSAPNSLLCEKIDGVTDSCSSPLIATVSSKTSVHEWIFTLQSTKSIKAVALLQDTHRNHFAIDQITVDSKPVEIKNNQEWKSSQIIKNNENVICYTIKVRFKTDIFGTFRQSIVFDFHCEPILVKHLCVDVVPVAEMEKIHEIRKEISVSMGERWTPNNCDILPFHSDLIDVSGDEWENTLKVMYPCPQINTFVLSHATVSEKKFTRNNYRERMHELLFVEEMARYDLIAHYNLTTKLQIAHSYILSPNNMAASTAKYSNNGELFASIVLAKELSEDTSEGRLILMHCHSVYLSPVEVDEEQNGGRRKVYEALIEDKGKSTIYLRLSADTVQNLGLSPESDLEVQIQFQLNRIPYCEWHYTIDKMPNFKTIFPDTYVEPNVPWSPIRQWSRSLDTRLNLKQKEAIVAITTPLSVLLPPILVIGPFGTGKTFTLAQAIKELIKDPSNRILLCTHSNSAADLYIKDYLDGWVESGNENARPLRIYYQKRWVTTVNSVVQKYCLIKNNGNMRNFQIPTMEDISKHKVVVVTLSTSVYLSTMGLPSGFFTHILLDEAAQAIECETVTPLTLANEQTRVVLAGDHMQLGPDIFSPFAKERNLHISLLERLYDHYPAQFSCKILLCENYRAHESIIHFTSDSFYDQKLVASGKQPKHPKFYPLTFFTTRGEDVQDKNSTAFYNNSEVYEVVERVAELKRTWPTEWGKIDDQSIGVVTPYADQVFRIRSELRKRRIDNVCVERVLNVQGKQFRAIILSTVRTRRTCTNDSKNDSEVDYGFLSNSKLLNTAITRAQSLVAVVGDPIALCSLGRCSKVWERFVQICNDNSSLYGITWTQLKLQLDGIELKKIYTLNPLAPEFVPRKYLNPPAALNQQRDVTRLGLPLPNQPNFYMQPNFLYSNRPPFIYNPNIPPPPMPRLNGPITARMSHHPVNGLAPPINGTNNTITLNNSVPNNLINNPLPPPIHNNPIVPANVQLISANSNSHISHGINSQLNLNPANAQIPNNLPINQPNQLNSSVIPQLNGIPPQLNGVNGLNAQIAGGIQPAHLPILPNASTAPNPINGFPLSHGNMLNRMVMLPPPLPPHLSVNPIQQQQRIQQPPNKLIQFMNNVHFPEAQAMNDCINLLPTNMSLADMLQQPLNYQERWYFYLKDCLGVEAAEKFKYLMHNSKGMRLMEKSDSPTFGWYDNPNGGQLNVNKSIYLQDQEAMGEPIVRSNPLYGRHTNVNFPYSMVVEGNNINDYERQEIESGSGGSADSDLQNQLKKHINEEFANLSITNSSSGSSSGNGDIYDVFTAFTNLNSCHMNDGNGSRLYKYFK